MSTLRKRPRSTRVWVRHPARFTVSMDSDVWQWLPASFAHLSLLQSKVYSFRLRQLVSFWQCLSASLPPRVVILGSALTPYFCTPLRGVEGGLLSKDHFICSNPCLIYPQNLTDTRRTTLFQDQWAIWGSTFFDNENIFVIHLKQKDREAAKGLENRKDNKSREGQFNLNGNETHFTIGQ